MAIVGHFDSLTECQKLVQSELLAGVIQETYEEGQLLQRLPVMTIDSKSILYNRESTLPSAAFYTIHEEIPFSNDTTFSQVEVALKIVARQDILDHFIMDTYKNPNDYRSIILSSLRKGCMRTIENNLIYGDVGTNPNEPDGISRLLPADIGGGEAWAAANLQAYDMGGASAPVTMKVTRELIDKVRPKPSILLMTRTMRNTYSAVAFEKGIVLANATGGTVVAPGDFGKRIDYIDGIPVEISDYLQPETDNTCDEAGSATGICSVWAIRFGQILDGGVCLVTGGSTGGVNFFKMVELNELEDYDAGAIRLVAYYALAQGSSKATAVIHSIDEDGTIVG